MIDEVDDVGDDRDHVGNQQDAENSHSMALMNAAATCGTMALP